MTMKEWLERELANVRAQKAQAEVICHQAAGAEKALMACLDRVETTARDIWDDIDRGEKYAAAAAAEVAARAAHFGAGGDGFRKPGDQQ